MITTSTILETARGYVGANLSTFPVKADGSKAPACSWAEFQERRADDDELRKWFGNGRVYGLAIVGGAVSGNLEILDFDEPGVFDEYATAVEAVAPGLIDTLPVIETPSDGRHLYYRCETIQGNQKLAMRRMVDEATGKPKLETIIETRGTGGYVLAPGCPTQCHEAGRLYLHVAGPTIEQTPTITADERDVLLRVARSFSEVPPEPVTESGGGQNAHHQTAAQSGNGYQSANRDGLSPGDDYNARASWDDILPAAGWRKMFTRGAVDYWQRPGKTGIGHSGTTGIKSANGTDLFCCFSQNALPFEGGDGNRDCTSYSKFAAFAVLYHDGDYSAAAKELAKAGYGEKSSDHSYHLNGTRKSSSQSGHLIGGPENLPQSAVVSGAPKDEHPLYDLAGDALPSIQADAGRTEVCNAQRFISIHGDDVRYCERFKSWLVWDGRRWRVDDARLIELRAKDVYHHLRRDIERLELIEAKSDDDPLAKAKSFVRETGKQRSLEAMLKLARSDVPIRPAEMDADAWALNVLNGTLDLRTGELRPHDKAEHLTKLCEVAYDANATCPQWEAFLDKIMASDAELVTFLQRAAGYSLTGDTSIHALFLLWGLGSNGKSTFMNTLLALWGGDYGMKAPPDLLMAKRNDTHPTERADLFGKRMVATIEAEDGRRFAEGLVKELTGGDSIRARKMHQDFFEFRPSHKLWLATNHKPEVRGTDRGIWRRLKLIPFTVTIPDAEQDPELPAKLLDELPGILAWALRGCLEWQQHGLGEPDAIRQATASYRNEMDVLGTFLDECCVTTGHVRAGDLYAAYKGWCEARGEHLRSQTAFGRLMAERGFEKRRSNGWLYDGLGLLARDDQVGTV